MRKGYKRVRVKRPKRTKSGKIARAPYCSYIKNINVELSTLYCNSNLLLICSHIVKYIWIIQLVCMALRFISNNVSMI